MHLPVCASGDRIVSILHPSHGQLRAKTIVSRSNSGTSGKYPSWKMKRMMQWRSIGELNAFRLLDAEPAVLGFREFPLLIRAVLNGKALEHYPQVQVDLGSRRELWRICTVKQATSPSEVALTSILQTQLPLHGYTYRIVTAESLALEPRLSIAIALLRYGRKPITLIEREHMRCILEKNGFVQWGATDAGVLGARGRAVISRLTLEGLLRVDYDAPLHSQTVFTVKSFRR